MGFRDFLASLNPFSTKALTIENIQDNFYPEQNAPSLSGSQTGLTSNVIMSPVMWVMRTFTEAEMRVQKRGDRDIWANVADHPLEILVSQPNPFYDGDALMKGTALSYTLDGNAYWWKIRNVFGEVVELWYLPHWLVTPVRPLDGSQFVSHYEYRATAGTPVPIAPRDIVHIRFGIDPENTLKGLSELKIVLREVLTDDRASQFSEVILRNMGVPGLVISPKDANTKPSDTAVAEMRNFWDTAFSGERRGKPVVTKIPTDVQQFGFDPNKLMLANLRDISEERVCAALGIPAAVVGFGSGLQSTKVGATMRELRRLAWVQCLTPMQKSIARAITAQLLPDFQSHTRRFRARFDMSDVSSFPEDDAIRTNRIKTMVDADILRIDRAQEMLGLEVDTSMAMYRTEWLAKNKVEGSASENQAPNDVTETTEEVVSGDPTDDTKTLHAIAHRFAPHLNGHHS